MDKLKITGCDLYSVKAISGSAQQHGTVYWVNGKIKINYQLSIIIDYLDK